MSKAFLHGHDDDDDDDEMMLIVIYPITSLHTTQLIPTKDPPRDGISGHAQPSRSPAQFNFFSPTFSTSTTWLELVLLGSMPGVPMT